MFNRRSSSRTWSGFDGRRAWIAGRGRNDKDEEASKMTNKNEKYYD